MYALRKKCDILDESVCFFFILLMLISCSFPTEGNIKFKDPLLKASLVSQGIDINKDGEISYSEASVVQAISLHTEAKNLEELKYFVALGFIDLFISSDIETISIPENMYDFEIRSESSHRIHKGLSYETNSQVKTIIYCYSSEAGNLSALLGVTENYNDWDSYPWERIKAIYVKKRIYDKFISNLKTRVEDFGGSKEQKEYYLNAVLKKIKTF